MKTHLLIGVIAGLSTFSSACSSLSLTEEDQEIVNGTVDSGHRQVVRVSKYDPSYPGGITEYCTGTLINSNTVLTARHCTVAYNGQDYNNVVVEGSTLVYDAELRVRYYEAYEEVSTSIVRDPAADLALVRIPISVAGVPAARVGTNTPTGAQITLVGYGGTSAGDPNWGNTKRYGFNTIDRVDATYLYYDGATGSDAATCYGDSGGPAFAGGYTSNCVVGVTKGQLATASTACSEAGGEWYHTRVDARLGWIQANATVTTCTP